MKVRKNPIRLSIYSALLAGLVLVPTLRAQVSTPPVANRVLLIFDTSSAMKKRLPAEEKAIRQLFAITLNGHLHQGDTVGVWTFNQDLHIGQFPLQEWTDDKIATLPDEIVGFLKQQHYTKETSFDGLLPTLNQVVRGSPRLTTLIFCDGNGTVKDIPGIDAINTTFKQHYRQMEKARVPFVIVLRSQFGPAGFGRYVGCTINSADSINIPQFPPMPVPPAPTPAPVQEPPPPPPPLPPLAPMIIVGTNAETNAAAPPAAPQQQPAPPPHAQSAPPASASVPPAASPAPAIPLAKTNSAPPPPPPTASIEPTNPIVPPARPGPPATATVAPPESSGTSRDGLVAAGAGLLVVAVGALYLVFRRSRSRTSPSLITESLKKR
ncbi:MAG TPA: hypothetical protein VMF08_22840 [Candidatus Sulfotelmatobacter sp.]|nr:hypothetical protein [Candidatus Sulfotelmatobacter sp.]